MANNDKVAEIIGEISVKHGVAIGRDDPIMILQTINARLMQDSMIAQQKILDRFKEELEIIAHRWGDDARNKAERILNATLEVSKEAMLEGMRDGTRATAEAVRREIGTTVTQIMIPIRESRRVALMNLVAAGMTVFAASLALWATL